MRFLSFTTDWIDRGAFWTLGLRQRVAQICQGVGDTGRSVLGVLDRREWDRNRGLRPNRTQVEGWPMGLPACRSWGLLRNFNWSLPKRGKGGRAGGEDLGCPPGLQGTGLLCWQESCPSIMGDSRKTLDMHRYPGPPYSLRDLSFLIGNMRRLR